MSPVFGFSLAQLKAQAQAHARDLAGDLATFSSCAAGRCQRKFFRSVLDNCDLPIRTFFSASILLIRRFAIVQLLWLATGTSVRENA